MSNADIVIMGLKNLWRRKARTILTILGVIIGTSSIVVMLSLGIAMNENFKEQLAMMGSINIIDVYSESQGGMDEEQKKGAPKLDEAMLKQFEAIEDVEAVTPVIEEYVTIKAGSLQADMSLIGMEPSKMETMGIKLMKGRLITEYDKNAVIFGAKAGENFYNPKARDPYEQMGENSVDIMNERLKLSMGGGDEKQARANAVKIEAVGIMQEGNYETDWSAYTSIEMLKAMAKKKEMQEKRQSKIQEALAQSEVSEESSGQDQEQSQTPHERNEEDKKRKKKDDEYERAKVKVSDINNVEKVKARIDEMGFQTRSLTEILQEMKKTAAGIQAILGGIGAVSLFVAALGITNTMIMSIYERTREIGVMKVIGAEISDIKKIFLFEAGIIGFVGGIAGIVLSVGVSFLVNHVGKNFMAEFAEQSKISVIPVWLVACALVFSTFVGIAAGYYPAKRAMSISALEAIKTE